MEFAPLCTDSTTVLQWLHSIDKPTFVAHRVREIKELTTVGRWYHVISRDNPADTGKRGLSADCLKESCWGKGPSFLLAKEWPFKPNWYVVSDILSMKSVDGTIEKSTHALTSTSKQSEPVFVWEKYSSFTILHWYVCFMLRLLPKHKDFCGPTAQITDPAELAIAKDKLLLLAQSDLFSVAFKQLQSGKTLKRCCRIAGFSPFIGPGGIIRSTCRIQRLVKISFETMHTIILDSRHLLVKKFLRHLHLDHNHQHLDFLRSIVHMGFVVLGLRVARCCFICRKPKACALPSLLADIPVERLGYRHRSLTAVLWIILVHFT